MNILIVDDESITLHRLQHFLEKWGHHVVAAQNGIDALGIYLSQDIDLVITDWMMPEMDGLELVQHIRTQGRDSLYVYIILLTSRGKKEDVVQALTDGKVDDYVIKPFDLDELRARVGVGERIVALERALLDYGQGLEKVVRKQTEQIRQTQEEAIFRLLTALESRDQETGGHVRRISLFSAHLAERAGWSSGRVDNLRLASAMHDIGKIGIPDKILLKKGRLSPEEFEIIKSHTIIGGKIFNNSHSLMLQMAGDVALYHHERWDGKGYPEGLQGEEIPESARLVALVDVYDALCADRIYRKACTESEVMNIMEKGRGGHFDPRYYDLFLESIEEFKSIAREER